MEQAMINQYITISMGVLFLLNIILFILLILNRRKVKKMLIRYNRFMKDATTGGNLDDVIESLISNDSKIANKIKEITQNINDIKYQLSYCGQKISLLRYNAFDNVGSDQSFSLAVLDEHNTGFVITGIYARESTATYAKPIKEGKSRYPLSHEENIVLEKCMNQVYNKR